VNVFVTVAAPDIIELCIASFFFIPVTIVDIRHYRVPDALVFWAMLALLIARALTKTLTAWFFCYGLTGYCSIWILRWFFKGGIGLGDAKLSAFICALLGLWGWVFSVFIASLSGSILALAMMRRMRKIDKIPFAPFLSLGCMIALFLSFGES
jgi:leader peptidase (prepilin peptidase)/N-methyltransferase